MWLLLILVGLAALIIYVVTHPPLVVRPGRPPARIDEFDAHPRHVCHNDIITANWRADAESGTLTAGPNALAGPFFSRPIDRSLLPTGSVSFPALTDRDIEVELMLSRPDAVSASRRVLINFHGSPNNFIRLTVQTTFTETPRGWSGRRRFSSDPGVDIDDWSRSITVAGLQYVDAGGRDIIVRWDDHDLGTLTQLPPGNIHTNTLEITVAGTWDLFVPAGPGDGPDTPLPSISIDLMPRCFAR